MAVAMPFAAKVRLPVDPVPAWTRVSELIAIVTVLISLMNVIAEPIG